MTAVVVIVCDRCGTEAPERGAPKNNGGPQAVRERLRLKGWRYRPQMRGQRPTPPTDLCPPCSARR